MSTKIGVIRGFQKWESDLKIINVQGDNLKLIQKIYETQFFDSFEKINKNPHLL